MGRLFLILAGIAVVANLLVGFGTYFMCKTWVTAAKRQNATIAVNAVSAGVSAQIQLLNDMLDKMAKDPDVLAAASSKDPATIAAVMTKLELHFPQALKLRLLFPDVSEASDTALPRMGFADVEMVRETFTKPHPPEIQGQTEADRHLALTRGVVQNNQVVAVILASMAYSFIPKSIQPVVPNDGYIELRQDKLILSFSGTKPDTEDYENTLVSVPGSSWQIVYFYQVDESLGDIAVILTIIAIPALFMLLAFSAGHRRVSGHLSEDIRCVMKAFKDMMTTQKLHGGYPVHLEEMNGVIPTLLQFKRVLDSESFAASEEAKPKSNSDLEIDSFFDDL